MTLDRNGFGKNPTGYGFLVVHMHCPNKSTQTLSLFAYIKEQFQGVGLLRACTAPLTNCSRSCLTGPSFSHMSLVGFGFVANCTFLFLLSVIQFLMCLGLC